MYLKDIPRDNVPSFLCPRENTIIPSPPFSHSQVRSLISWDDSAYDAWQKIENSSNLYIAHALNLSSQRRILEAYFLNSEDFEAFNLIQYSPFIILGIRQLVSGTLIDLENLPKNHFPTMSGIGFLMKVPPACIYIINRQDANVSMEKLGVSQTEYRHLLFKQPSLVAGKPKSKASSLNSGDFRLSTTPQQLLSFGNLLGDTYNEIAFFPRLIEPENSVEIVGTFIDTKNHQFKCQPEKGDQEDPFYYYENMRLLSDTLKLPLIDLQSLRRG